MKRVLLGIVVTVGLLPILVYLYTNNTIGLYLDWSDDRYEIYLTGSQFNGLCTTAKVIDTSKRFFRYQGSLSLCEENVLKVNEDEGVLKVTTGRREIIVD